MAGVAGQTGHRAVTWLLAALWLASSVEGTPIRDAIPETRRSSNAGDTVRCPPFTCRFPRQALGPAYAASGPAANRCYQPGSLISVMCPTSFSRGPGDGDEVQQLFAVCDLNGAWDWPYMCGVDLYTSLTTAIVPVSILIVFFAIGCLISRSTQKRDKKILAAHV